MKPVIKIGLIVVVLLIVIAAAFFVVLPMLRPASDEVPVYEDEVSLDTRTQNTNLYAALVSAGIEDPFVDVDTERAYVAYALPEGFDADMTQRFVIGAAADAAFDSGKIIATQYEGETPKTVWTVEMADFKALLNGEMTGEELDAKIVKEEL